MTIYDSLIVGDPHIEDKALEELDKIFTEVISYKAKRLIILGDYYTKNRPTAKELEFGTRWASTFKKLYDEVILLKGNHTKSGEGDSAVDYLKYLNIQVVEDYIEYEENRYYGHFMLNESNLAFNTGEMSLKELNNYDSVVLGHQHCFQQITPKIIHLGAIRRVDYGEASYDTPQLLAFDAGKPIYLPIVSYTGMKIQRSISDLKSCLRNMKVLYVFSSYSQFLTEIDEVNRLKKEFIDLKVKLDFKKNEKEYVKNENKSFNELLKEFLASLDEHSRKEIEEIISYEI